MTHHPLPNGRRERERERESHELLIDFSRPSALKKGTAQKKPPSVAVTEMIFLRSPAFFSPEILWDTFYGTQRSLSASVPAVNWQMGSLVRTAMKAKKNRWEMKSIPRKKNESWSDDENEEN